ncbi:hypothetical protein CRENPOLYSF1_240025 [Crenothrix polyspora]|uniref:Uncharacterized protein n=1 Tax=Crenothrix polyspora TaxID=360316 RepID=A0A1R4H718_9GAMM|nr:hypothetical protein CRENPOLYSF1_240025 [Crenothrix polyspora]
MPSSTEQPKSHLNSPSYQPARISHYNPKKYSKMTDFYP